MSVKLIIGYLKLLNRVLQHHQIDLAISEIKPDVLHEFYRALEEPSSDGFDVELYLVLLEYAQRHFKRPIGLVLAEHASLQDFGLVGYLASTSLDLDQAMMLFEQYYPLLYQKTNREELLIERLEGMILLKWIAPYQNWQLFYELNVALIFHITDSLVQEELIPPDYIGFGYSPQFALHHYERFFRTNIRIETQEYSIRFPIQNLKARSIAGDVQLNQVLSDQAKQSLNTTQPSDQQAARFKQKVVLYIEQALQHQRQGLQSYVAEQMHCSERTLQRQLVQHHLNFQALVAEYRFEKSKHYLMQGKSLSEIADLLNYADQSAFGRAFKRWSGYTPKQFLALKSV